MRSSIIAKTSNDPYVSKLFLFGMLFIALSLSGCDNSVDGSSSKFGFFNEDTVDDNGVVDIPDTALANHIVSSDYKFLQFNNDQVTIDLSVISSNMTGDYYVVKLFNKQQTYYLARITELTPLSLSISLPTNIDSVDLEVFSNDPSSRTIRQTIKI